MLNCTSPGRPGRKPHTELTKTAPLEHWYSSDYPLE